MSWSTLLTGNVDFKKGKTYDEVKEVIHYFCKYSEVDEPDIIEKYDHYWKKLRNSTNNAHIIIGKHTIKLDIQDINWTSDRDTYTLNALEQIVAKYKDLIDNVSFSLYYLNTADVKFYYDDGYDTEEDIKEFITADVGRYYKKLIKDGIIDVRKLMLYKLKENEEDD